MAAGGESKSKDLFTGCVRYATFFARPRANQAAE
jgi:hypothetical protein